MFDILKTAKALLPKNNQEEIDQIHARVENELVITERKIKALNKYLKSEAVADLLIQTLKEKNANT